MQIYHTSLPDQSILTSAERLAFLALVADGVGGAKAGEEASRVTLEYVARYVSESLDCYYTNDPGDDSRFIHELEESECGPTRICCRWATVATISCATAS
ncbi:MAG: hypothetical protein Q7S20_05655 [Gemmatimonadaceae bacterium]|nr:hypothetical protein [Gemmatimonadaceae bacterium]